MVLKVAATAVTTILPSKYYLHALVAIITVFVVHAFAQGRKTNRERDLHARVILVTGGFTPLGLTLLHELAIRGAHIIALSPLPIASPQIDILVSLLRTTTNNEQVYAEECDLASPASIHAFCSRFLKGDEKRLDAVVFAHEYQHVGSVLFGRKRKGEQDEKERREGSLVERDIRIINIINPFYAAAVPTFSPSAVSPPAQASTFQHEGTRALRTAILTRHLQRILDALPSAGQLPKTDETPGAVPLPVSKDAQKSNIVAVSVCPGISRDSVKRMLGVGDASSSKMGIILYTLFLLPIHYLLLKSPRSAVQSVLHALFLPTPFKSASKSVSKESDDLPEEVLRPGALYRECAVVRLNVPAHKEKEKEKEEVGLVDDGELGGEVTGRMVWESFEVGLKAWEAANPSSLEDARGEEGEGTGKRREGTPPEVDRVDGASLG